MAMMLDPMNDPRVRNNPEAMGGVMRSRNDAAMGQLERDRFGLEEQAFQYRMSPEGQAAERRESARAILSQLPPEMMNTPFGRQLQQEAMGGQQGGSLSNSLNPQPRTVEDAMFDTESLAPRLQMLLGFDPRTAKVPQLLDAMNRGDGTAAAMTPEDQALIQQFIDARSMSDPDFAEKLTRVQKRRAAEAIDPGAFRRPSPGFSTRF
jgi:hypothetical protein